MMIESVSEDTDNCFVESVVVVGVVCVVVVSGREFVVAGTVIIAGRITVVTVVAD